jgi:hypothetical protein
VAGRAGDVHRAAEPFADRAEDERREVTDIQGLDRPARVAGGQQLAAAFHAPQQPRQPPDVLIRSQHHAGAQDQAVSAEWPPGRQLVGRFELPLLGGWRHSGGRARRVRQGIGGRLP